MNQSTSIGINKWANGQSISFIGSSGNGDNRIIGWMREDGMRAIETNGDPVWEDSEGFESAWESLQSE